MPLLLQAPLNSSSTSFDSSTSSASFNTPPQKRPHHLAFTLKFAPEASFCARSIAPNAPKPRQFGPARTRPIPRIFTTHHSPFRRVLCPYFPQLKSNFPNATLVRF